MRRELYFMGVRVWKKFVKLFRLALINQGLRIKHFLFMYRSSLLLMKITKKLNRAQNLTG